MVNIYGYVNENATATFEKAKKIKLLGDIKDNLELKEKIKKVMVEVCIKCEDVIEAFYQYDDKIIFSPSKDELTKELLYNALRDSKEIFLKEVVEKNEENVSYYKKTIGELTAIIEELREENNDLIKQNTGLVEKVKKMEEERVKIFEWIKNNPVKTSNENVITKLADMELLSDKKGVYTLINKIENEKNSKLGNQLDNNINKEKIEDKNEREE